MMDIIEISEENIDDFRTLLGEDLSEDVNRIYFNGIGAMDEEGRAKGALVYELLNSESEEDTKGRICLVQSGDEETADSLEDYYSKTSVKEEEIVESFYELETEADAMALVRAGFSSEKKEDDILTVTLGELSKTALGKKQKGSEQVENISSLSILQFRKAVKDILFKGHKGIMEDIPYLPKDWFDNDISACISSGDRVSGLFLVRRTPSGILIPALLFAYGSDSKKNLLFMLRYSLQQALHIYPPETNVCIPRKNAVTRALTDKLITNRSGAEIFFGIRREK